MRRLSFIMVGAILLSGTGCSRNQNAQQVVVEIPPGFSGDFVLDMGIKDAAPLMKSGDQYLVTVPKNGSVATSSLLVNPKITFKNSSDGAVWGYSHSVFTTGDGIPVGGKIEFFVGTKKEFEAEQGRRNHSSEFQNPVVLAAGI
jgi:hypothetical protein